MNWPSRSVSDLRIGDAIDPFAVVPPLEVGHGDPTSIVAEVKIWFLIGAGVARACTVFWMAAEAHNVEAGRKSATKVKTFESIEGSEVVYSRIVKITVGC
jgi:hypothetical protein